VREPNTPRNWGNWPKRMVADSAPLSHDRGAKQVLGRHYPAGQSTEQDLEDTVAILMQHDNIAPFVALRFIQHLVMSDPSPAYIGRVAAAFRNNGKAVSGDMKAVIKAVLLDPEARRGDDPARSVAGDGKVREPMLQLAGTLRGLGCQTAPIEPWSKQPMVPQAQAPFMQASVFGFYAPTDRAPGSNLLAPEQKLLNSATFFERLWHVNRVHSEGRKQGLAPLEEARCGLDAFVTAYRSSMAQFADLIGKRYLRGAPPQDLALLLAGIDRNWRNASHMSEGEVVIKLIEFALLGSSYGAMQ
jgi:Protein of unknown function (DUF1800)